MTFIGHIVNRDTASVEVYVADTYAGLERQIDERYAELRKEMGIEEPAEDEDDELGEYYDWDWEQTDELVSKAKYDAAMRIAVELCRNAIADAIRVINHQFEFDKEDYKANLHNALKKLEELGLSANTVFEEVVTELREEVGEDAE